MKGSTPKVTSRLLGSLLETNRLLLHITRARAIEDRTMGAYQAGSLQEEGFIHCSTPEQLLIPANALFRGQSDLVILCIDARQVPHPIIYEDCYGSGHQFPHVYGAVPWESIVQVLPFPPEEDGSFLLPKTLRG